VRAKIVGGTLTRGRVRSGEPALLPFALLATRRAGIDRIIVSQL